MFTQRKAKEIIELANDYIIQSRDSLSRYTIESAQELADYDFARCGQAQISTAYVKKLDAIVGQLSSILDNHMRIYRYGLACRPKGTASYHYTIAGFMSGLVECGIISKREAVRLGF